MSHIEDLKSKMRIDVSERRVAIPTKEKLQASRSVISSFMGNIERNQKDVIAGYHAIAGEIDIKFLMEAVMEDENTVVLPVVQEKDTPLVFREYKKGMDLIFNAKYRTYEPPVDSQIITPNILIVPLLAFDNKGYRLGFGGGFYDRTIEQLRKTRSDIFTVGIAYDVQKVRVIPYSEHDQKLDCVITEKRVYII